MQPCESAHARKARRTTSVMRCDVSTLPAHTAAIGEGLSIDPGGMRIVTGSRQPLLSGISRPTSSRSE